MRTYKESQFQPQHLLQRAGVRLPWAEVRPPPPISRVDQEKPRILAMRFSPSPQQMEFQPGRSHFLVSTARPGHLHALQGGYCREHNMRRVAAAAFWSAYWRTHVPNARDLYAPAPRPPEDSRAPEERTEERGNALRLMMLIMMLMDDQPHQLMYLTITFRRFSPSPQQMEFQPGRSYFLVSTARPGHLHALQGGYCRGHNMRLQFRVAAAAFWLACWRTRVPDARDPYAPDPRPPEDPRAPRSGRRSAAMRAGSSAPPLLLPPTT